MYKIINDPYTGIAYSINSIKGINVLKEYIHFNTSNMLGGNPTARRRTLKRRVRKMARRAKAAEEALVRNPNSEDLQAKLVVAQTSLSAATAAVNSNTAAPIDSDAPAGNAAMEAVNSQTAVSLDSDAPAGNASVPQVLEDEKWSCDCDNKVCTCKETSGAVPLACTDYAIKTATAGAELALARTKARTRDRTIVRLTQTVTGLMEEKRRLLEQVQLADVQHSSDAAKEAAALRQHEEDQRLHTSDNARHEEDQRLHTSDNARHEEDQRLHDEDLVKVDAATNEAAAAHEQAAAAEAVATAAHNEAEAASAAAKAATEKAEAVSAAAKAAHAKEEEEHRTMTAALSAAKEQTAVAIAAAKESGDKAAAANLEAVAAAEEAATALNISKKALELERTKKLLQAAIAEQAKADAKNAHHEAELATATAAKEHAAISKLKTEMEVLKGPKGHFTPLIPSFRKLIKDPPIGIDIPGSEYVFGLNMPLAAHERKDDIFYITLAKIEEPDAAQIVGTHNHTDEAGREYFAFEVLHDAEGGDITSAKIVYYYDDEYHDFMHLSDGGGWELTPDLTDDPLHQEHVKKLYTKTIARLS